MLMFTFTYKDRSLQWRHTWEAILYSYFRHEVKTFSCMPVRKNNKKKMMIKSHDFGIKNA